MSTNKISKKKSVVSKAKSFKSITSLNKEVTKTVNVISKKEPDAATLKWNEMEEELQNDNYIYRLHNEFVTKALQEIKEEKLRQQRVDDFVESFCRAWLKLVRWRWMFRDDTKIAEIPEDIEPTPVPKDPWASFTYKQPMKDTPRTTLPPPKKCCPQSDIKNVETFEVPRPQIERLIRRKVAPADKVDKVKRKSSAIEQNEPKDNFRMGSAGMSGVKPTAFPERATGKIYKGTITSNSSAGNKAKPYVTQVVLGQEEDNEDNIQ